MSYVKIVTILKGGRGSGNFGHAGRPGHLGGSQSGGGTSFLDHDALQKLDLHQAGPDWGEQANWRNQSYGGVIFDDEGRVLLRKPTGNFGGYAWTFPKGRMDNATEHPVVTALREVEQETGHTGQIIGLVPGQHQAGYGSTKNNFFLMKSSGFDPSKMDWETEKLTWATPDEAEKLIKEGSNKAGVERDLKVLAQATQSYNELHTKLKGNVTSGNWGHAGRPGKRGGSQPGGGHAYVGAERGMSVTAIQRLSYIKRTDSKYKNVTDNHMKAYYDLQHECGVKYDCGWAETYTGSGYKQINSYLRGDDIDQWGYPGPQHVDDAIMELDTMMENARRTPVDMKVYRGVSRSVLDGVEAGDTIMDDGYVSTTIDPEESFTGAQLEIRVPKGARAVYLEAITANKSEYEMLLDRSSRFKVLKANYSEYPNGERYFKSAILELIP